MTTHNKLHGGRKRKNSSAKMMKGGGGAGDHANAVFGGMSEQHAGANGSIHQNPIVGGMANSLNLTGVNGVQVGGRKRRKRQCGGFTMSELAVPAGLLAVNQLFKPRVSTRGFNRRRRSNRRSRSTRRR